MKPFDCRADQKKNNKKKLETEIIMEKIHVSVAVKEKY